MHKSAKIKQVLFRDEACSEGYRAIFGRVLICQPWGYTVAACIAITIIVAMCSFFYLGSYARKVRVSGVLMPEGGILRLVSNSAGVITEVKVSDGAKVKKGEILFVVSAERVSFLGGTQKAILAQLTERISLLEQNMLLLDERLRVELGAIDAKLVLLETQKISFREERYLSDKRLELAKASLERQEQLMAAQFVSVAQVQLAQMDLLELKSKSEMLNRAIGSVVRENAELVERRRQVEIRHGLDRASTDSALALVRQERAENEVKMQHQIISPIAGTLAAVNAQVGQRVVGEAPLASLIPSDADLKAHIFVLPSQIGFIEVGHDVLIRYEAYPYQKFGVAKGKVSYVANVPYALQELPVHVSSGIQSGYAQGVYYKVVVQLEAQSINVYGKSKTIQPGMLLEADVGQDRRRLYEWLLEPLFSIGSRI
jgi:membrane fusion protein